MGWTWYPHFDHQPCTKTSKKTPIRFCDMLSSHTARRSFATNSYTAGIPISSIMTVTGHSSERNFRKYLGLQAQDRAIAAAEDFKGFIKME
jgi:integrase